MKTKNEQKHEKAESTKYEAYERKAKTEPEYRSKGKKPTRGGKRC